MMRGELLHASARARGSFDRCIAPALVQHVARLLRSTTRRPTTGLIAAHLLVNVCDELRLFGFDFLGRSSRDVAYHYYDERKPRIRAHGWTREQAILQRMQALGLLQVETD